MSLAKKSWKRAIALFLAVVMAIAFAPNITSFAATSVETAVGGTYVTVTAADAAYTGSAYAATTNITYTENSGTENDGNVDGYTKAIKYQVNQTGNWVDEAPSVAGTHNVKVIYTPTAAGDPVEIATNFTITKAKVTLSATTTGTVNSGTEGTVTYSIAGTSTVGGFELDKTKLATDLAATVEVGGQTATVDKSKLATDGVIKVTVPEEANAALNTSIGYVTYSDTNFEATEANTGRVELLLTVGKDAHSQLTVAPVTTKNGYEDDVTKTGDSVKTYSYRLDYTTGLDEVGPTGTADADTTGLTVKLAGDSLDYATTGADGTYRIVTGGLTGKVNTSDNPYYTLIIEAVSGGNTYQATMRYVVLPDNTSRVESVIDADSLKDADKNYYVYGNTKALSPKVIVYKNGAGHTAAGDVDTTFNQTENVTWYYFDKAVLLEKSSAASADAAAGTLDATLVEKNVDGSFKRIRKLEDFVNTSTGELTAEAKKYKMENKPENAGDYFVLAVIKADDKYAVQVPAMAPLHIDKKPLFIVPSAGAGKTFGQEETAIGFTAYEYYNVSGKTYGQYLGALVAKLTKSGTEPTYNAADGTFTYAAGLTKDDLGANVSDATFAAVKAEYENVYKLVNVDKTKKTTDKIDPSDAYSLSEASAPVIVRSANTYDAINPGEGDPEAFKARGSVTLTEAASKDIRTVLFATGEYADDYAIAFNADAFKNYVAVTVGDAYDYVYPKFNEILVPSCTYAGLTTGLVEVYNEAHTAVINNKYTIAKRPLNLTEISLLDNADAEKTKAIADRTVKSTDTYTYNDKVIEPDFKVLDTVSVPVMVANPDKDATDNNGDEFIVSVAKATGKVEYSPTNKLLVGYKDKTGTARLANNGIAYNGEFTLNEEGSTGKGSGTYTLSFKSDIQNYTGTASKVWQISNTGKQYDASIVYVNADNAALIANGRSENTEVKGIYDDERHIQGEEYVVTGTYTIPYDGKTHTLAMWVNENAYDSKATTAEDKYVPRYSYDKYDVIWTVMADYEYIGIKDGHSAVLTEKAGTKYTNTFPTNIKLAGTYKLHVDVVSLGKNYDSFSKDITIEITKVPMTIQTVKGKESATIEAYSTRDEIVAALRVAQNNAEKSRNKKSFAAIADVPAILGKNDDLTVSGNILSNIINYDTYSTTPGHEYDALDRIVYTFEFDLADMNSVGTPDVNVRLETKDEVLARAIADQKTDYNDDDAWAKLTDDQRLALYSARAEAYEAARRVNDNYIPTFVEGNVTVQEVSYDFGVFVHDSDAWDAVNSKWLDLKDVTKVHTDVIAVEDKGTTWNDKQNADPDFGGAKWVYGAYDVVGKNVDVFVKKATHYTNNVADAWDYSALSDALKDKLTFDVVTPTGKRVSGFSGIAAKDLEAKLFELPASDTGYKLNAYIDKIAGEVGYSSGISETFKVAPGQLIMKDGDDYLKGATVVRGGTITALEKAMVYVDGGKTAINPTDSTSDSYHLEYSYFNNKDFTKDLSELPIGTDVEGSGDYTTASEQTIYVIAVNDTDSLLTMSKTNANLIANANAHAVKITITNQPAGENDKVDNLNLTHTADQKGKTFTTGVSSAIVTTYGKYTYNDKNSDGSYKKTGTDFIPVEADNEVTVNGLLPYITNELLYHNGYAVGKQNTFLRWKLVDATEGEKLENGRAFSGTVLERYPDAEKVAYAINYNSGAISNSATTEYDETAPINNVVVSPVFGYIWQSLGSGELVQDMVRNGYNSYIEYNETLLGAGAKDTPSYLLAGINKDNIKVDVTYDPNNILASEKVTIDGVETTKYAVDVNAQGNVTYKLADTAENGRAVITVTVSRTNFTDITFDINVIMDADVPQVSVKNIELSTDPSVEFNKKATVDTYVKSALEFNVDVTGALEKEGAFYFFANEPYTSTAALEAGVDAAVAAGKTGWTELKENTVKTPEGDGPYVLYVYAIDEAGNKTYVSSANGYTVDTVAPVIKNAEDTDIEYGEEVKEIVVPKDSFGTITVVDSALESVKATLDGDTEAVELEQNTVTKSYKLTPNEKTYTVVATDKAKNVTSAKIDVLILAENKGNELSKTYDGKDIDLENFEVDGKKLFEISELAGEASYKDVTGEKVKGADGTENYKYAVTGVRGEGTVDGNMLKVTKAGTFVIELTTAKKGIYGSTPTYAYLTINKGTREVGISLVNPDGSAKADFSDTEAVDIKKYVKLTFSDGSEAPADEFIKLKFYKKGAETAETDTPAATGDYEVAVEVDDDGLYNAAKSVDNTVDALKDQKKASYTIDDDNNKIKITNEDAKGTVKVTKEDGTVIEDLNKVAKRTKVVIEVTPAEGYTFTGWTDAKGIEFQDPKATKLEAEVSADIELTTTYKKGIAITEQPKDAEAFAGETETFKVVATGDGEDDLTYQWFMKGAKEADFKEIVGATEASYTTAKVTMANDGEQYKVVITSKASGEARTSDVATLKVVGHSLEGAVIELEADSAEYTGKNIAPVVKSVKVGETELAATRDYDVVVAERVNAGEYEVKITGKGDYSGEATAKFTITPKALTKDMFSAEDVNYTGKAVETTITGKDGEVELKADTDYTVAYKNNTEVGTATATVTGKGNYTGSVDVTFEVLGKAIKGATVTGIATAAYTGKAITPAVTVKLDGKTLKKGTDYTVTYKNNTKVGTATVTITGKGDYSGTITKKFLIKKISFKYRAYVQKKNWMAWSTAKVSGTSASAMAGTTDNLRMETIQMQLAGVSGAIKYRAYVEKMGWTQWATTADTTTYAGTKGMARRVEMIQLQASGQVATLYDMYYRAYSEKFGWLGWAKSGEKAGSAGYARKLEAFQVNFVRKGESFTVKSDRTKCFYDKTKDGANPK